MFILQMSCEYWFPDIEVVSLIVNIFIMHILVQYQTMYLHVSSTESIIEFSDRKASLHAPRCKSIVSGVDHTTNIIYIYGEAEGEGLDVLIHRL